MGDDKSATDGVSVVFACDSGEIRTEEHVVLASVKGDVGHIGRMWAATKVVLILDQRML